jgi:hypothetical protein
MEWTSIPGRKETARWAARGSRSEKNVDGDGGEEGGDTEIKALRKVKRRCCITAEKKGQDHE